MIFNNICVEGFGSYGECVVFNLDDKQLSLIIGSNGAGKSFLIEAIEWCLFGKTQRGLLADEYINRNYEAGCVVTLCFTINNVEYSVERFRNHVEYGTGVEVEKNNESITKGSVTETNKLIVNLIGMDFDTFTNSVIITGDKVSQFISGTDAERKGVLGRILNFAEIDKVREIIREEIVNNSTTLTSFEGLLDGVNAFNLVTTDDGINDLKIEYDLLDKEIEVLTGKINDLANDKIEIENKLSKINFNGDELEDELKEHEITETNYIREWNALCLEEGALEKKLKDWESHINECNDAIEIKKKEIKKLNKEIRKIKRLKNKKRKLKKNIRNVLNGNALYGYKINAAEESILELNTQLKLVESMLAPDAEKKCLMCGQEVSCNQLIEWKININDKLSKNDSCISYYNEKTNYLNKILNMLTHDLEIINDNINKIYLKRDKKRFLENSIDNDLDALGMYYLDMSILKGKIISLREKKNNFELVRDKHHENMEKLKNDILRNSELNDIYLNLDYELDEITIKLSEANKKRDKVLFERESKDTELATAIKNNKIYNEYIDKRTCLVEKLRFLNILDGLFGWKGIKVARMKTIVSFIKGLINKYLGLLSDDLMIYSLDYDSNKETYVQSINKENIGECSFNMLSNGEKKRVMTAAAFALGELVGVSNRCNLLCLDEADSGLDEFGQKALFNALKEFKRHKPDIFVITHLTNLQNEVFDNIIRVEKKSGFSKITTTS